MVVNRRVRRDRASAVHRSRRADRTARRARRQSHPRVSRAATWHARVGRPGRDSTAQGVGRRTLRSDGVAWRKAQAWPSRGHCARLRGRDRLEVTERRTRIVQSRERYSARRSDRALRTHPAAALHRARRCSGGRGPIPDGVRARGGFGRRADRRPALHAGTARAHRERAASRVPRSCCMWAPERSSRSKSTILPST